MRLHHIAIVCLAVAPACGPAAGGPESGSESNSSESGSESDSNSSLDATDPTPSGCAFEGAMYESGQTFQSSDGCVEYLCDDGALVVEDDLRVSVPGDLELASQEDVDAQSCLSDVQGSLTISGTAADLTPLRQLTHVGGQLDITAADVVTLNGLEGLAEIGEGLVIAQNAQLTTLVFQPYMSVFGDVTIDDNDALVSLAGAGFIGQCPSCSVFGDDGEGTTDGGEDPGGDSGSDQEPSGGDETGSTGGTFYGNILISNNDVLTDISAMGNLVYAWASVRFRNNTALTSLAALQIVQVQGDLEISGHPALADVDAQAFAAAVDVFGLRTICGNLGGAPC